MSLSPRVLARLGRVNLVRGGVAGVAALLALGCGVGRRPAQEPGEALARQPESFVSRVARLRQLSERRPTPVLFDAEDRFQAVADRKAQREAIQPTAVDLPAVQLALGLIFAARGAAPAKSFGALHRSQMIAFYDEFEHQVHVRKKAKSDVELPFVVAHELGHALQFQHFRVPEVANVIDEDARLARLSLIEGDAMLVMAAFAADEHHLPLSRVLVRMADGALEASLKGYEAAIEENPELKGAAPFQRERLVFPYQSGARFVAQVHRAGGFALVNRLYDVAPATTEQVLHPEKYLAGEQAVPVRAPATPKGYQSLRSGHVGELLLRAMLQVCNESTVAYEAAAGWGGDAFTVVARGEQGGLLLVTTWDTEQDAREFERALRATASCWDRAPAATRAIFGHATQVRREGSVVGVVRGLPRPLARQVLLDVPQLVGARIAATPPLGNVAIPPVRRAPRVPRPSVQGDRVVAPKLGLSIPIPAGLRVDTSGDEITFSSGAGTPPGVHPGEGFASLLLAVSDLAYTSGSVRYSFDAFERALKKPLDSDQSVSMVHSGEVTTPLGNALERVWQIDGTPIRGRLLLIPICRGTGMLLVGEGYGDDATRQKLDRAVAGLAFLPQGSPICAELDP